MGCCGKSLENNEENEIVDKSKILFK